jgi:hypothetical protein
MDIIGPAQQIYQSIEKEAQRRSYQASNELRNASLRVLRGQRSGRRYRVPFTRGNYLKNRKRTRRHAVWYTASAPGEPPAVRTGTLRNSWWPRPRSHRTAAGRTIYAAVFSPVKYAYFLEAGKGMAPRPFVDRIKQMAMPRISAIYRRPYNTP